MNEKQKDLSTADAAVVAEQERTEREKISRVDQVESRWRPVVSHTSREIYGEGEAKPIPLLPDDEVNKFESRWNVIQTAFVDEPHAAVEDADQLVSEIMDRLAEMFAEERSLLEEQWTQGDDVSTEHLRLTLQRYRSFFQRLLSL